ncbi:MAG: transporter [Syntrophomonadaceae bacterium]|nr:transporter [Syntrophomonadaceae bacterium]
MGTDILFLLISIVLSAAGQILLKYGVMGVGNIDFRVGNLFSTLLTTFTNVWVLLGVICFVTSMVLWLKVISTMELSKAYPSVSLSYVIVFIFSAIFFNEGVSIGKFAGLASIMVGIFLLQR